MDKLNPPEQLSFEGNVAENWRKWKQRFELFSAASGLSDKDEKVQSATLLHVAGPDALEIYNTFSWDTEGDENKVEKIKERFEGYCNPRKNITWERHVFNTCDQDIGETIDQYVTKLKTKAKSCEFGTLKDSLIRDRIVCGISSDSTRAKLLREANLTIERAIDICRADEAMVTQMKMLGESKTTGHAANLMEISAVGTSSRGDMKKYRCDKCGGMHRIQQTCPALGAECHKCGKRNHFARVCRSKTTRMGKSRLHSIEQQEDESSDKHEHLFVATIQNSSRSKEWNITIKLNKQKTVFKIDTGAQCNVISKYKYNQVSKEPLQKSRAKLVAFGGHKLTTCGKRTLLCEHKKRIIPIEFQVVDQDVPSILGLETSTKLKLVQRIDVINNKLTDLDVFQKYRDVFEGFGCITKVVHHIAMKEENKPVVHPPRRVPVTLRPKIKEELQRMERLEVIEKVQEATEWVNSMVVIRKPNGKLRICIDPRDLNKVVKREHYPMRTIEEIATRMPNAKFFTVLDASSGYWQVQLDTESARLCTFNTPFGRYKFKRLPFGLSTAPDVFQKVMAEMFENIEGVEIVVDDILVWGETEEQHDARLIQVLEQARARHLTLNEAKCHIKKQEVSYIGHILSKEGLKPDPKKTQAIKMMNKPNNKEELQRFLGMITYLAKFIPNLSQTAAPLRILLEKETEWHWDDQQQGSFELLKQLTSETPVLKYFDPTKPVKVSVDASSKGMGAVLMQEDHPVAYASKALNNTQQNYAQIEKEMLAIVFGCTRFHQYIFGMPQVEVETDHKPLETILKKPLHQAPARLQKMVMVVQKYPICVRYHPGKELVIADTLSRAFITDDTTDPILEEFEINVLKTLPISEKKLKQFQDQTEDDPVLQDLKHTVENGWPTNKRAAPLTIAPYWNCRDEITISEGILFKGERVIVPKNLQPQMLSLIHSSHMGTEKCKRRAKEVFYWPGMNGQIENVVSNCPTCNMYQRSNMKEPLLCHEVPSRPWAKVGADLCELNGKTYLVLVDYYSGFIEVNQVHNTRSTEIIRHCKAQFARYGIPDILMTDNGPQFSSESFKSFASTYQFKHLTSSPHFPQSNGMAEKSVQTAKNLIKKAMQEGKDPYLALLEYRNTPNSDSLGSPAQRLMGRRTKSIVPMTEQLLKPKVIDPKIVQQQLKHNKQRQKYYYDVHTKSLPKLLVGDDVVIRMNGKWRPAKVSGVRQDTPRSYHVTTPEGQTYRRNRRHLKKVCNNTDLDTYLQDDDCTTPLLNDDTNTEMESQAAARTVTDLQTNSTPMTLRRSQRQTKKPERYCDSYM